MRSLLLAVLLLAFAAFPAFADWSGSPVLNMTVASASGLQQAPTAIPDGSGGVIVVWVDGRFGTDIFAQRFDSRGKALWTANGVPVCTNALPQDSPTLCSDGAGGAIIAWKDSRFSQEDIFAQRISGAGVAQWVSEGIGVCIANYSQLAPRLLSDGAGGAFVTWYDWRNVLTTDFDIYAQRLSSAGVAQWTANGVAVCTSSAAQTSPMLAPDGNGGVVVVWQDGRNQASTGADLYAQRLNGSGTAFWTANGVVVCNAAGDQNARSLVTDGTGTLFVAWTDLRVAAGGSNWDIYMQALGGNGAALWTANGVALCTNTAGQRYPYLVLDGLGGVFAVWSDLRAGANTDLYGQHVTSGGLPLWAADGVSLASGNLYREVFAAVPDGAGGFTLAYTDNRSGQYDIYAQRYNSAGAAQWTAGGVGLCTNPTAITSSANYAFSETGDGSYVAFVSEDRLSANANDLYAQRVDRYGYLGMTEPRIASVKDVPGDQGGRVKLSFYGSSIEDEPWYAMNTYYVYRSLPTSAPAFVRGVAREALRDPAEAEARGVPYVTSSGAQDYFWELLTTLSVSYMGQYSVYAATAQDSFAGGKGRTVFMVQGRNGSKHWDSLPDSGWSVDNLSPLAPAPLTAQYVAGAAHLHWNPNTEADLAGYRLYRGSSPSFLPGPANFVAEIADTGHTDTAGAPYVYKLTAVDIHGNESPVAMATPTGTTGVEESAPRALSFALASPNPAHSGAALRFSLHTAARIRVAVYDAAGREVRSLLSGECAAGWRTVSWDGADAAGCPAPSGLYFARLQAGGQALVSRFVLAR